MTVFPHNVKVFAHSASLGTSQLDGAVYSLASMAPFPATTSSYNSVVNCYLTFCHSYSLTAFPLTELTLCQFVAFLFHKGVFYGCICLRLCALRHHQLLNGGIDTTLHSLHHLQYVVRWSHKSLQSVTQPRRLSITIHRCWSSVAQNCDIVSMWAACCIGFLAFCIQGSYSLASPGLLKTLACCHYVM